MAAAYAPPVTMSALKDYVQGASAMQAQGESTVLLHLTHNQLKARFPEIRLDKHMSVEAVKRKVNTMTGTAPSTMALLLLDEDGRRVAALDDYSRKLGFYAPRDGWRLHVVDADGSSLAAQGWLEDVSKVAKYVMSEEDYAAREGTYRAYKQQQLAADPAWTLQKEMARRRGVPYEPPAAAAAEAGPDHQADEAAALSLGQRCCVEPGERRGEIRFVGRVAGLAEGFWVGVAFDEPLGKNDGSAKGVRYFDCAPGHGGFVRPDKVQQGDFPPLDEFCSSELGSDDEI